MTVNLEQIRRDETQQLRRVADDAVTEGVNLRYVEQMRRAVYAAADRIDVLLAELEQAEKERDETSKQADRFADRLAKVPALVEALKTLVGYSRAVDVQAAWIQGGANIEAALAAWDSE